MKKLVAIAATMLALVACADKDEWKIKPQKDASDFAKEMVKMVEGTDSLTVEKLDSLKARVDFLQKSYIEFYTGRLEKIDDPKLKELYTAQIDTLKTELEGKAKAKIDSVFEAKTNELNAAK